MTVVAIAVTSSSMKHSFVSLVFIVNHLGHFSGDYAVIPERMNSTKVQNPRQHCWSRACFL